jgi:hypothetical protein
MKVSKLSMLLIGSSLLLPASVFAANTIKKSLHLYEKVTVEGKQLTPGDYKVEWNGMGPNVKLNILKGKETLVTVPAKVVSQPQANDQDGYALKAGKHGNQALTQVFFSGEKYDLNLGQTSSASASQGASSSGAN